MIKMAEASAQFPVPPTTLMEARPPAICDCVHPIEPYYGIRTSELMEKGIGTMLNLPTRYLYGTQALDEYIPSKTRSVHEKLQKCGIACLEKNPPLACVLFESVEPDVALIAIRDGHHRIRDLGRMHEKPRSVPILALTVEELSNALTEANPNSIGKFTPEALRRQIDIDMRDTLGSFRNMPITKHPEPIVGVKSMQDLEQRFGFAPSKEKPTRKYPPYDLLYDGINLAEKINGRGQKLVIPDHFLFGTQEPAEYSQAKRKTVREDLRLDGIDFLRKNPVIVLMNVFNKGIQLTIVDGHHRTRFAPQFGIHDIPCLVVDPQTLVDVINKEKGSKLNPEIFSRQAQQSAADVLKAFGDEIPDFRSPDFVFGAFLAKDLARKFSSF
jgi:hypothetical protein